MRLYFFTGLIRGARADGRSELVRYVTRNIPGEAVKYSVSMGMKPSR